MKTSSQKNDPAAEEQASLWAARLEGGVLDAADRMALDAWLAADPAHRGLLSSYCQFSADLEEQLPILVAAGTVSMPEKPKKSSRSWKFSWVLGTAMATAAVAMFAVFTMRHGPGAEAISTATAHRQSVTLRDGTRVELNARTTLAVELSRTERRVTLSAGEAFFSVSEDKTKPFTVVTPTGSVWVTGTAFGVRTGSTGSLDVTVVHGSVRVQSGASESTPVNLVAGDALSAGKTGVSVRKLTSGELDDTLAWRQGQIVFDDVPLREAAQRFAEYHGRGIKIDQDAAELGVGGRFSLDDFEGFFAGIARPLQVRATREADGTMRVSRWTEPQ